MNILRVFIFLLLPSSCFGQNQITKSLNSSNDSNPKFEIVLSTFNHAERIYNGTTTYWLTDSLIKITKLYFGDTTSETVYSKSITNTKPLISKLKLIDLNSLKDFYFNNCVMITSGDEFSIDVVYNSMKKSISLHHYYLEQLDDIVQIINSTLPNKYKFRYLSKSTKQGCP